MYSFLQDGEFVQLTVEEEGRVTGFISRYGDLESDRGEFLDLFFKSGKLDGKNLNFTTQTVHGVWYEFKGTVERGPGKNPGDEAYYLLKGTLTQNNTDANKKTSSKSRDVTFKSFPQDMGALPRNRIEIFAIGNWLFRMVREVQREVPDLQSCCQLTLRQLTGQLNLKPAHCILGSCRVHMRLIGRRLRDSSWG